MQEVNIEKEYVSIIEENYNDYWENPQYARRVKLIISDGKYYITN